MHSSLHSPFRILLCAMLIVCLSASPALAWRSTLYPTGWTGGDPDGDGKFLPDFSYAGYEMGERDLPDSQSGVYIDVTQAPFSCDRTGGEDVTSRLQSAIDLAGASGGGTVYLPSGTYRVTPQAGRAYCLRVKDDNVLIKGDGSDKTFLYCSDYNLRNTSILLLGGGDVTGLSSSRYTAQPTVEVPSGFSPWDVSADGKYRSVTADIPYTPVTSVTVSDATGLAKGDWIVIRSDLSRQAITDMKIGGFWSETVTKGQQLYRRVTSVSGSTVSFDIPTRYPMKAGDDLVLYKVQTPVQHIGVAGISIGCRQHGASTDNKAQFGDNVYNELGTAAYTVHNSYAMAFVDCANCYARDVRSYRPGVNSGTYHLVSNGAIIKSSRSVTLQSCDFSHTQYQGGGGNGYGFAIDAQECLLDTCSATDTRHSFSFKNTATSGNVIYKFTSTGNFKAADFHMYLSVSNLIDSCTFSKDRVQVMPRPYGDALGRLHGLTSSQSVLWNTVGKSASQGGSPYVIMSRQYGYGYIIGTSGANKQVDVANPTVATQYGKVYTAPEDYTEGVGTGATLEPQSLYKDQLHKRTGR